MKKFIYKHISRIFLSGCSQYNALAVRKSCRSKEQARVAFAKLKLPHAKGGVFINPCKVFAFAKKYGFPLVIKPNVGGYSRGAYFPITTKWQLFKASIFVKKWWHKSIIEQYLAGKNYRILVAKDGIVSVIRRYPPFVIGDGVRNVSQLIDEENNMRATMGVYPTLYKITKNKTIIKYLKRQHLKLDSVIDKDRRIYLHYKLALKTGGIVETIDKNELTPTNVADLQKIVANFAANVLGIDVICQQGLTVDFKRQKTVFLEVNSRPYIKMHEVARYGQKCDLTNFYKKFDQLKIDDKDIF